MIAALLLLGAGSAWARYCSPIVIDMGRNGIDLGERGVGVHFDVNNDGLIDHVQWLRPRGDETFLALDRNYNGVIDDGSELFGVGTPLLLEGGNAPNGFVGLAQYDSVALGGNDDGLISAADTIWPELRIWRDVNADGVSTPDEILTPRRAGLSALQTIPRFHKYVDEAGNIIPYWAWALTGRERKMLMVDVFFRVLQGRMAFCDGEGQQPAERSTRTNAG
jgi:hypothetical protein